MTVMGMKDLPIGVQTFDKIVEGGYMYVDKTGYVYEIANKFEYVFLCRPRRVLAVVPPEDDDGRDVEEETAAL